MKELTSRQIAAVKRQYKNSKDAFVKIQKLTAKIAELSEELELQTNILEGGETGIKALTGGYRSIDLIKETYEPIFNPDGTPKMSNPDKEGKTYQQKKQVLEFVYPTEELTQEPVVVDEENHVEMVASNDDALEAMTF